MKVAARKAGPHFVIEIADMIRMRIDDAQKFVSLVSTDSEDFTTNRWTTLPSAKELEDAPRLRTS